MPALVRGIVACHTLTESLYAGSEGSGGHSDLNDLLLPRAQCLCVVPRRACPCASVHVGARRCVLVRVGARVVQRGEAKRGEAS